jgi:hypothetical protein
LKSVMHRRRRAFLQACVLGCVEVCRFTHADICLDAVSGDDFGLVEVGEG